MEKQYKPIQHCLGKPDHFEEIKGGWEYFSEWRVLISKVDYSIYQIIYSHIGSNSKIFMIQFGFRK